VSAQHQRWDRVSASARSKALTTPKVPIKAQKVADCWALPDAFEDACAQDDQGRRQLIERSPKEIGVSLNFAQ
jgi:hypothetical protein